VNFGLSSTRLTGRAVAIGSIHSSCGKSCGKTGHEDRNSLIHNEKDQAAHKWVYCFKVLIINTLINLSKIRVPVGEDSAGSPEKTGFSTIGFREWPTGRGFWRSGPCKSNTSGAFDRRHGNMKYFPWYRSTLGRVTFSAQEWETDLREQGIAAGPDQAARTILRYRWRQFSRP
jgi:hypothetical protein